MTPQTMTAIQDSMAETVEPRVVPHRADLSRLIREALAQDRVQLAFQPVVTAGVPPETVLHEGFIRILDEVGRILPAQSFMAAVEESPLGRDLDGAALRLGLQALRRHPRMRLAINMSARSVGNATWRQILEEGVAGLGHRLTLEIGEASAMLLPDRVTRFMAEMRPKGVSFALDDFGAGAVSFWRLKDFRFDCVKIDRSLVARIEASPDNQVVARALIAVAHQFGMSAIAEGVESEAEAARMRALGVDFLQGYLFGRPRARL
ncbi:Putative cyclic di-GMP phosphodiesterase, EAL domain protein [Rubellimicrobium mesophilum DSM 19309]|uniref:Putative cyclic di-GMP phosphodiesterase, EAL domain protein n=1 Tax=Rubellimicrobium mesophilum DSM 19309 TaxID=442562 RepID=A0A017HLZ3_9RHOB|nr:EAL domain-containing protein [Rubellimicrobium mesophilum]EYD75173.1 Putative cyclic di-GMP phosphodiesterase, EAL domain protein [Rubellimicrobium mesophilum DSM 19309]